MRCDIVWFDAAWCASPVCAYCSTVLIVIFMGPLRPSSISMRTPYMEGEPMCLDGSTSSHLSTLGSYAFGDSDEERYSDYDT